MISRFFFLGLGLVLWSVTGAAESFRISVLEGDGAINNIRLQRAKEPVIKVETESGVPVSGAIVYFTAPSTGPGGVFFNGRGTATAITDAQGRATARGFRPNRTAGQFQIRVTASHTGRSANARIVQTNAEPVEVSRGSSRKLAILAIVGGAVAGGAALAARSGGKASPGAASVTPAGSAASATSITVGTPSFGAP